MTDAADPTHYPARPFTVFLHLAQPRHTSRDDTSGVRKLALLAALLAAATVPGIVLAGENASDGCLVVQNANGVVTLSGRGTLVGRFDTGQVTITDPVEGDGVIKVLGAEQVQTLTATKKRYFGDNVRFRASGKFVARVGEAIGIDLSAVARGKVTLGSSGFLQTGTYSIDSDSFCQESFKPVPDLSQVFTLGTTSTG